MIFLLDSLPPGSMFALDAQTLIRVGITLFNVLLLAFVMTKLLYKPVREMMLKRTIRIREQMLRNEEEQTKVNELKTEYERMIKDIDLERTGILAEARKLAVENSKKQLDDARSEAESIKARAFQEIALEQERVQHEMKKAIIDVSSAITGKFLTRSIDADTHEQLFNETMAELEELAWHS